MVWPPPVDAGLQLWLLRLHGHRSDQRQRGRLPAGGMAQCPQRLPDPPTSGGSPTVVMVGQLHRGIFEAIRFARTIASDLVAVHVDLAFGQGGCIKGAMGPLHNHAPQSIDDPVAQCSEGPGLQGSEDGRVLCLSISPYGGEAQARSGFSSGKGAGAAVGAGSRPVTGPTAPLQSGP